MPDSDRDYDDDDYDYDNNPFATPFINPDNMESSILGQSRALPNKDHLVIEEENPFATGESERVLSHDHGVTDSHEPESSIVNNQEQEGEQEQQQEGEQEDQESVIKKDTDDKPEPCLDELYAQFLKKYQLIVKITKILRTTPGNNGFSGTVNNSHNNSQSNNNDTLTNRRGDLVIYIELITNLPTFRKKTNKNIVKSYKEFENFGVYLQDFRLEYFHDFYPPSIPLNKTSYGLNNEEDLIQCKINFQKWFDLRISNSVKMMKLEELAIFLESDFNTYLPMNGCMNTNNNTTTSVTSSNNSLDHLNNNDTIIMPTEQIKRKTLKQFHPPFDSVQELATFRPLIKTWRKDLKIVQSKLFKMSKQRQSLSFNENSMGKNYIKMSENMLSSVSSTNTSITINNSNSSRMTSSEEKVFSNMYKRLGKTMITIGDMDSIMATLNMATLYDGLEWCCRDLYNVKEQLTNRHLLMRELNNVTNQLKKNQEYIRKLRSKRDTNPIKIDESFKNLQIQNELENKLKNKLDKVSQNLLYENNTIIKNWEEQNVNYLKNFALKNIEYERKKLLILERIRTDVRKTDKSGGLSRLGRSVEKLGTYTVHGTTTSTTTANNDNNNNSVNDPLKSESSSSSSSQSPGKNNNIDPNSIDNITTTQRGNNSNDSWSGDNRVAHEYYGEIEKEMQSGDPSIPNSVNGTSTTTSNNHHQTMNANESLLFGNIVDVNTGDTITPTLTGNEDTKRDDDDDTSISMFNSKKYAAHILGQSTF